MAGRNKPKVTNYPEFKAVSLSSRVKFTYITGLELRMLIPSSDYFKKNIILDGEVMFIYKAKGLLMVARPKFSEEQNAFISSKGGAKVCIIRMADQKVMYTSKMFYHWSRMFWSDLGNYAYICKLKIDRRPICPCLSCNFYMDIAFKSTNQVYWVCRKKFMHPDRKYTSMWWDVGLYDEDELYKLDKNLPNAFVDFLEINRKRNRKYLKKLSKQYKKYGKIVKRRSRM